MGGTRSSHLPLDRKSVLNIISFRSSMPARRDVGNAGGGKLLLLRSRCVLENIFLSLSLFISRFFIHFHRLTVFIITAHFAFWHFSHEFFVAFFYTYGPLPLADGDGEQRQRRRRQRDGEALNDSFEYRYQSLQLHEWRQPTSGRAWQVRRRRRLESNWQTAVAVAVAVAALHSQLLVVGEGGRTLTHTHVHAHRDTCTGWHNHDRREPNP